MTIPTLSKPIFMRETKQVVLPPAFNLSSELKAANIPGAGLHPSRMQTSAFEALQKIGLPNTDSEDFNFIRVGEILPHLGPPKGQANFDSSLRPSETLAIPKIDFIQSMIYAECRENYAVFVDGIYVPQLSCLDANIKINPLGREHEEAIMAAIQEETDAAATLAMLYAPQPILIDIAPKSILTNPLQILHYRSGAMPPLLPIVESKAGYRQDAFIVIHAGIFSESKILIRHIGAAGAEDEGLSNHHTLVLLKESASLQVMESGSENENQNENQNQNQLLHFRKITGRLDQHSHLLIVSAHTGSRLTRNSFAIDLLGSGADVEINGAAVLTGNRQAHNFIRIRHRVPNCTSRQQFKSVAADKSRSSVDGTIFVAKDAQGTNAYQRINNLMLSDEARCDSKPQLMIFADDVKCAHGATVGKLDASQLFYLVSRGLSADQARTLMTVAFIAEILEKAGPAGAKTTGLESNFRRALDHALLDSLKLKLPV